VYAAQQIWPDYRNYPDVDTAFVHVARRAGGPFLFALLNATLLIATIGSGFGSQLAVARLLYGMGRDNSLPRRFFGSVDAKRGIPVKNVLLSGFIALGGALMVSYELGAELLNFGAFIAFMGVNAAAVVRYCVRGRWTLGNALPPLLGFAFCFYMWLSLSLHAKIAGSLWLTVGLAYGAAKGKFAGKAGSERP
jgi:amino acid transporter